MGMSWGFENDRLVQINMELTTLAGDLDVTLTDLHNNLKEAFNNVSVTEFAPGIRMVSGGEYPAGRRLSMSVQTEVVNKLFNHAAANANAKRFADIEEGFAKLSAIICRRAALKRERDLILNAFAA